MIFKKNYAIILLIFQIITVSILSNYPSFIEKFYSLGLYQIISSINRKILSFVPFSFGDILYLLSSIYCIYYLFIMISNKKLISIFFFKKLINFFNLIFFIFYFQWGLNYLKLPISEKLNIKTTYSIEELNQTAEYLIIKTNELHKEISIDDSSSTNIPYSIKKINEISTKGFSKLSILQNNYPNINLNYLVVKESLFSLPLTYLGFSGYVNPFTNESQINYLIPKNNLPHTSSHEIAHQLGFANEIECNFLAFLNTINSEDKYFKYNGYKFALKQCLNEIYKYDIESYKSLIKLVNTGILKDYKNSSEFWNNYSNPFETITKSGYDKFLKMNNIKDGIESYSMSISLIINYLKHEINQVI